MNTNSKNLENCNFCYYCNSCDFCDYCYSCNSCDSCYSCYYSKNLKMTEYNTFCYSKSYNDENSFQQKRYRVFNTEVGKDRYYELLNKIKEILSGLKLELNKNSWSKEWEKVTQAQWQQLMLLAQEVRGDNFKEGFEFISGITINEESMITLPDGRKFSASTIQEALKRYVNGMEGR